MLGLMLDVQCDLMIFDVNAVDQLVSSHTPQKHRIQDMIRLIRIFYDLCHWQDLHHTRLGALEYSNHQWGMDPSWSMGRTLHPSIPKQMFFPQALLAHFSTGTCKLSYNKNLSTN